MGNNTDYHRIVFDLSQRNKSVLKSLDILGRGKAFFNRISHLKVQVSAVALERTIQRLQGNMRKKLWPIAHSFYFHLYNEEELIIVFKERIFEVKPDKSQFGEIIEYGRGLGIPMNQLDFIPYQFEDGIYCLRSSHVSKKTNSNFVHFRSLGPIGAYSKHF
jgi:hypothetical protein